MEKKIVILQINQHEPKLFGKYEIENINKFE